MGVKGEMKMMWSRFSSVGCAKDAASPWWLDLTTVGQMASLQPEGDLWDHNLPSWKPLALDLLSMTWPKEFLDSTTAGDPLTGSSTAINWRVTWITTPHLSPGHSTWPLSGLGGYSNVGPWVVEGLGGGRWPLIHGWIEVEQPGNEPPGGVLVKDFYDLVCGMFWTVEEVNRHFFNVLAIGSGWAVRPS